MLRKHKESLFKLFLALYITSDNKAQWILASSLGIMLGSIISLLQRIFINFGDFDVAIVANIIVLVTVDTILGIYYAYQNKSVSSEGFARLFKKISLYFLLLIATHAATHLGNSKIAALLSWIDSTIYAAVVSREFLSILEKAAKLGFIKIPDSVKDRLEIFHKSDSKKEE
jgi:toxin secretion/phage lysis holin